MKQQSSLNQSNLPASTKKDTHHRNKSKPSRCFIYETINLESLQRKRSNDRLGMAQTATNSQTPQLKSNPKSKSKTKYLAQIQTHSSQTNKYTCLRNKRTTDVNPELLKPVLQNQNLQMKPIKHRKKTNERENYPIKSLNRPTSGQRTHHEISILSGIQPKHSHNPSWQQEILQLQLNQKSPQKYSRVNQSTVKHSKRDSGTLVMTNEKGMVFQEQNPYDLYNRKPPRSQSRTEMKSSQIMNEDIEAIQKSEHYRSCEKYKNTDTMSQRYRREMLKSQNSDYIQSLMRRVKSAMSRSIIEQPAQSQQEKDPVKELKMKSSNRLEQLKNEMKQSLIQYKEQKEALRSLSREKVIQDNGEIRKVSAFAQSVLTFSDKIEKLIKDQRVQQRLNNLSINDYQLKQEKSINKTVQKKKKVKKQKIQNKENQNHSRMLQQLNSSKKYHSKVNINVSNSTSKPKHMFQSTKQIQKNQNLKVDYIDISTSSDEESESSFETDLPFKQSTTSRYNKLIY